MAGSQGCSSPALFSPTRISFTDHSLLLHFSLYFFVPSLPRYIALLICVHFHCYILHLFYFVCLSLRRSLVRRSTMSCVFLCQLCASPYPPSHSFLSHAFAACFYLFGLLCSSLVCSSLSPLSVLSPPFRLPFVRSSLFPQLLHAASPVPFLCR